MLHSDLDMAGSDLLVVQKLLVQRLRPECQCNSTSMAMITIWFRISDHELMMHTDIVEVLNQAYFLNLVPLNCPISDSCVFEADCHDLKREGFESSRRLRIPLAIFDQVL